MMDTMQTITFLGILFGATVSFIAIIMAVCKFAGWIKRRAKMKRQMEELLHKALTDLSTGQISLEESCQSINDRLDMMDRSRQVARVDDAYIRTRQYIGNIATLDAIMQLSEFMGHTINGDVAAFREENIECLKQGRGIYDYKIKEEGK